MKTLCLDFGNTRLKAALFEKEQLGQIIILREDPFNHLTEIIQQYKPGRTILSSVIDHDSEIDELLKTTTSFHRLTNISILPVTKPVAKPETMGSDRLAIAAAASFPFPKKNNLAIGLGSCVTYNFINQAGEFLGGSISPGMEMRFRAMHQFTAKLPLVEADW